MNSSWMTALVLAAGAAGGPMAASAQQQVPAEMAPPAPRLEAGTQRRRVSIKEALQLTARQGPDVAAARAQAAIVEAGVKRAWTTWQPDITVNGTWDHSFTPASVTLPGIGSVPLSAVNTRIGGLNVVQPLLTPQGIFLPGIANKNAEAADRNADENREQILLSTARTYLALQGLQGLLEAAQELEKVSLQRERDARARIAAGTEVEIALLRAQSDTAQARAQIANRQGQIDSFLPVLEALTGEAIEPEPARVIELPPLGDESGQPWENSFSIRSAVAAVEASQKSVRLAQFLWLPSVSAGFREGYNSNGGLGQQNWTSDVLLSFTLPVYDSGQRYAQLAEDRARLAQAQAQLASVRARARSNWLGARANLAATTAVVVQSEAQFQFASRTQVQVQASYRAGVSTSLDLQAADQQRFEAQSNVAQARAELEIRKAELAATVGMLYALAMR